MPFSLEQAMKKSLTAAIIDLEALSWNYKQLFSKISNNAMMCAVVKADGYGHGAVEVAKVDLKSGAKRLAVARLSEALILREAGITAPILLFGYIMPENLLEACRNDIILSVQILIINALFLLLST